MCGECNEGIGESCMERVTGIERVIGMEAAMCIEGRSAEVR